MIKRIAHSVLRLCNAVFPLPPAASYAKGLAEHAIREAIKQDALADLHDLEAAKARLTAAAMRGRAARLQQET